MNGNPAVQLDVNLFIGQYPFRQLPHPDVGALLGVMRREGVRRALVGYLPAAWQRSCDAANAELYSLLAPHSDVLLPAPAINPSWPGWRRQLEEAASRGAPAVRVYPPQWGMTQGADELRPLIAELAARNLALVLTTRFEDARQRHWMDNAADLPASAVRTAVRAHPGSRVILTCAGRSLIEEVHWSLTPDERRRIWYDISWVWGPPQHDLAHLLRTVGAARFLFGSMWPLRLVQTPFANLDLLPSDVVGTPLADASEVMPVAGPGAPLI